MISPADVLCLALCVGLIALEGNRGIILALIDFACVLIGVIAINLAYVPLADHMRPSNAYLTLLISVVAITALLSIVVSRRLKVHVTAFEAAVGAILGLGSAVVLSYAFFEWLGIRYGTGAPIVRNSIVCWLVFDYSGFREFGEFIRALRGK